MDGGSIPSLVLFFDLSLAAAAKRTHLVLLCPLLYYCREASVFRCSTIFPRSLQSEVAMEKSSEEGNGHEGRNIVVSGGPNIFIENAGNIVNLNF